jgi:hypothetical protein
MEKRLRIVELAFAIAGAGFFAASWIMNYWMWQVMPTHPDLDRGFVILMINHGRTIYLSLFYSVTHTVLFWSGLALFLCAVIIDFYKDPFNWHSLKK